MNETSSVPDKKTATRAKILQAALVCFAQKGYHQTSMDEIVVQSGLSKGALYWHFKSKQELFIALVEWFMAEFSQSIAHAWTAEMLAGDKIRAMILVSVESSEQFIPFIKIFLDFRAQTTEDEQLQQMFAMMFAQFQNQLIALITEGIANGEFRPIDAPQLSLALLGTVDSLFLYKTLLGDQIDMRSTANTFIDIILVGLKNRND
jgi:AcrR family transcriptional regulator